MEASSSTSSSLRRRAPLRCYCAEKPVLVISWTVDNPGRRFMVVQTTGYFNLSILFYWGSVGRKCKYFQWLDDEICERDKVLIPKQRQQIIRLEAEVARCYKREKFLHCGFGILIGDMWDLSL
ncbi:uncharacterized protein LOC126691295 [Quercus robur]|uniref:uncharacterized protein LOC126691295 n=1 Tax=Quercus robur TaxID=38942 RepID=UPI002163D182|nr:uncharacterized protein LOC126691295 [Quercus robur]